MNSNDIPARSGQEVNLCLAHGEYQGTKCPHWPLCAIDPPVFTSSPAAAPGFRDVLSSGIPMHIYSIARRPRQAEDEALKKITEELINFFSLAKNGGSVREA